MTKKFFIILLSIIALFAKSASADNIEFTATAKSNVSVGESFVVTYSVNVSSGNFQSPPFTGFTVLSGPNQSSSSSTQMYNGKTIQTVNIDVTYILMAEEEGVFTIPPATIFLKGKSYKSNSLTITVGKGSGNSKQSSNNQNQRKVPTQNNTTETESNGNDIFIKAITDKKSASLGEQVILTYKLYTRIAVSQYVINKLSPFTGFWSQDITGKDSKVKQYEEVINGSKYTVAEVRKVALFPQKSGSLKLEPLEMECLVQIKTKSKDPFANFFNDPFFSSFNNNFFDSYQNVKKTLKSNTVTINVLPLPETNKPNDFNGAVGNYNIVSEIDNTTAKAGDAITLKVTVSGSGNLKLIDKLNITFPTDFEVYDPKIDDKITMGGDGMKGSRTFEYLIIPRNAGQFTIKPVSFSYFDLSKKQYVTLTTDSYTLNIAKGSGSESNVSANVVNKEDIKYIGSDIRYIKKNDFTLMQRSSIFFGSMFYWILFLMPVILFIIFVIIWRKKIKENSNVAFMKTKKATKIARKRLQTANNHLKTNNSGAFYEEVFRALWGYLSDKLNIPLSDLSKETVTDAMIKKGVSEITSSRFIETINNCEFARFAPGGNTSATMDTVYSDAANIITVIEKEINK